ncbi:MAG: hypothetical protein N2235_07310 [Fischerella sp.]|nr:hypothetical protein [Fischerella sp.]
MWRGGGVGSLLLSLVVGAVMLEVTSFASAGTLTVNLTEELLVILLGCYGWLTWELRLEIKDCGTFATIAIAIHQYYW